MKKIISCLLALTLLATLFTGVIMATGDESAKAETSDTAKEETKEEAKTEEKTETKTESTGTAAPADGAVEDGMVNEDTVNAYASAVRARAVDNTSIDPAFTLISENEFLALYAITDNSQKRIGEILILDKATGYVWRSNPTDADADVIGQSAGHAYYRSKSQLVFSYAQGYNYYDANSYYSCVVNDLVTCTVNAGKSVKFLYKFADLKFAVPVEYSLDSNGFKAELLLNDSDAKLTYSEIGSVSAGNFGKVEQQIDYNITEIKLLPAFGATSYNEDGYLFIPDGSGALVYYNNGKDNIQQPYSAPVYGNYKDSQSEDYRKASDRFYLPVFGTVKNDGHALMGIIEDNANVAFVNAEVSGYETAYNKVYSSYLHKIIKSADKQETAQPMSKELRDPDKNYSVKYFCLSGDQASYVGMAKFYREYLIDEKGMKKADDLRDAALFLDMYAGVEKKTSILGIPWKIFDVMTTYDDIMSISDDMTEAGISNVVFRYNDWTKKKNRTKVQNRPNFENSIGGKKGYEKAAAYLADKNMGFYLNIDFINYSKSGNGYSRLSDSVKYPNQAPAYQQSGITAHINMGTRWCLLKSDKVRDAAMKFAAKCEKNGITSVSLENFGNAIYSDGSNKGGLTRGQCMNNWEEIIAGYKEQGMNVLTTTPDAYAIIDSDVLLEIPSKSTYVEIADEGVPFYQIVVRGYKTYTSENINMSSVPEDIILNAAETGSSILYSLTAGDTTTLKETYLKYLYSCNYSDWKDDIIEVYKKLSGTLSTVDGQTIENHEKLAEGLYRTTYSNGVAIYVNYNKYDITAENGVTVPARDYVAERGEW